MHSRAPCENSFQILSRESDVAVHGNSDSPSTPAQRLTEEEDWCIHNTRALLGAKMSWQENAWTPNLFLLPWVNPPAQRAWKIPSVLRPGTVETSCPLPIQNKPKVNPCRPSSGSDTSAKRNCTSLVIQREISLHLRGFFALCCLWFKNFRASEVKMFLLMKEKSPACHTQMRETSRGTTRTNRAVQLDQPHTWCIETLLKSALTCSGLEQRLGKSSRAPV